MKFKAFALAVAAVFAFTSCGVIQKITDKTDTSSPDYLNGSMAATVLSKLASQYSSAGSLDLSNAQNILSISTLASNLTSLTSG